MEPSTIIETIDALSRAHSITLMWALVAGWATVGVGAFILAARGEIAALGFLFAAEMIFPCRYLVADRLRAALRAVGGEEAVRGRRPVQAAVIATLLIAASALLARSLGRRRSPATTGRLAPLGMAVGLLGFALETISLHQIDAYYIIYWSIWYAGLALALIGVARPLARTAAAPAYAKYSVTSLGVRAERDPPIRRLSRICLVLIALATPELVDLAIRLIAAR